MNRSLLLALAASALAIATACDSNPVTDDAGTDAGPRDSGPPDGGPPRDSGPPPDGGPPPPQCTSDCEFVELALGDEHSCARRANGEVWCWGRGQEGQLGDARDRHDTNCAPAHLDPIDCTSSPVQVRTRVGSATAPLQDSVMITSEGGRSTCTVREAGELWCWGYETVPLTSGAMRQYRNAAVRTEDFGQVHDASDAFPYVCMVQGADRRVICYGSNYSRQLGRGPGNDLPSPQEDVAVMDPDDPTSFFSGVDRVTGSSHGGTSCALRDGQVWCWGRNLAGQLGRGTLTHDATECGLAAAGDLHDCSSLPVPVGDTDPLTGIVQVAAGMAHVCALDDSGRVWCWGDNRAGQAGQDTSTREVRLPAAVDSLSGTAVQIDAAGRFTCARMTDGTVWCWGFNFRGQLGDGTEAHGSEDCTATEEISGDCSPTPVQVSTIDDATDLALGNQHACAIRASGEIWCWGYNNTRQLGDGTRETRFAPVRVSRLPE